VKEYLGNSTCARLPVCPSIPEKKPIFSLLDIEKKDWN